jgi:hypothetical protein
VYLCQDAFEQQVDSWLAAVFAPANLQATIDQMAAAQDSATDNALAEAARAKIESANVKLARYRAVIDAGGDLTEIGKWISEAKTQRVRAEADLRNATAKARITRQQIAELIADLGDIGAMLHDADQAAKAKVYRKAGVKLTHRPSSQLVTVVAMPNRTNIGKWYVSEERHTAYVHACHHR